MMVYVKANIGVSLEYMAPNITKAEKVEAGGGRLNINIEKNNEYAQTNNLKIIIKIQK